MSYYDYDVHDYYDYEGVMLDEMSKNYVQYYLGTYGDAVNERVNQCVVEAQELLSMQYYRSSLITSMTACELIIRYLIIRPLLQGAFMSEDWADLLTERVTRDRFSKEKDLLPEILDYYEIDFNSIKLPNGINLRETFSGLWKKRNGCIHKGESVAVNDAELGIDCVQTLLDEVVYKIAQKFGFTLNETGKWCEIKTKGAYSSSRIFSKESPF